MMVGRPVAVTPFFVISTLPWLIKLINVFIDLSSHRFNVYVTQIRVRNQYYPIRKPSNRLQKPFKKMPRPKNSIYIDGTKLRNLRDELDLSQEALVGLDGVSLSLSSLQRIERESLASRDHAYQLASALGVQMQDLQKEVKPVPFPLHTGAKRPDEIRILVGLGNLIDKYKGLSIRRKNRIKDIIDALRVEFSDRHRFKFNISGREGSLAAELFRGFQEDDVKRVNTFLPKLEIEKSLPDENYAMIGNVYEMGDYIEDRRQALLDQSDIVLITDGKRGISNLLSNAKQQRRKIVPLPFGIEAEGEFINACEEFESDLQEQETDAALTKWMSVKAFSSTPEAVAANLCDLIEYSHDRIIKRNVFIFHAMGETSEMEEEKIETIIYELGKKIGFKVNLLRTSKQTQFSSQDVEQMIAAAELCIAIVEQESAALHATLGIAVGMDTQIIIARNNDVVLDPTIRYTGFESVVWSTTALLAERLEMQIVKSIESGKIIL